MPFGKLEEIVVEASKLSEQERVSG